jgi:hypothetical protein
MLVRRMSRYPVARFPSEAITAAESLTKPKHFLTFQIVASVQKSGDVVAQQSSTKMHP